jgi:hypothetical protein
VGTETTRITFPDVIADANRRKTLAQASQIRLGFLDFLDPYLDRRGDERHAARCPRRHQRRSGTRRERERLFGSGIE